MSRLGGGIGTRGPGETKLETDRRRIRQRITVLKQALRDLESQRSVRRARRERNAVPVAAIVGYTNAGKSTLLNALTGSSVLSEDKLFATLDPTTRSLTLPEGENVLLTDTVGFIHKLPHHLIDAFRSTLEEAKYADIILHVTDASDPACAEHMTVVYETLRGLEVRGKPIITLFNKCDLVPEGQIFRDLNADRTLRISAKTGEGLSSVLAEIQTILRENRVTLNLLIPYKEAGLIHDIREKGQLLTEEYEENGIRISAYVPKAFYEQLQARIRRKEES